MSDYRGGRDEPFTSRKRGPPTASSSGDQHTVDMSKVRQEPPPSFVAPSKYDGYELASSLSTTHISEIKYGSFSDEPITGNASYIPSLADLNDNSELQELSFFNLQGVCQAEKEILLKIIQDSQWYSDSLFCFMRRTPSPSAELDPSDRCLNDSTGLCVDADGIPEVSGALDHDQLPDQNQILHNGPIVEIPQSHLPSVEEANMAAGVMSPGVPPGSLRSYYSNQPPLAVSSPGGPGGSLPPTSAHLPVSGGMVMYPQQMQQLMQQGHNAYPLQVGYPPVHYGYAQHGGQPHVTYVSPTDPNLSPENVHMGGGPPPQGHHKGHHEGHHGMQQHTPSSGPVYSKQRNHRRDNVKQQQQQQQQQQPYYYPSYGYTHGMHYHNHQQLAQNVTGSPIIMQAPGNLYPYHPPPHPSMYQQSTGELEQQQQHHQSSVTMSQPMAHMTGEIPPYAQQQQQQQSHHPSMYHHHSPTHSTSRYNQPPRQSTVPAEPPPLASIDPGVGAAPPGLEAQDKPSDGDISQSAVVPRVPPPSQGDSNVSNKSIVKESLEESSHAFSSSSTSEEITPGPNLISNLDSLSESSRDNQVIVDRIVEPSAEPEPRVSSNKTGAGAVVSDSQTKAGNTETFVSFSAAASTPAVNGELKDIKPGKNVPRDNPSADLVPSEPKQSEVKVKSPPSLRSVTGVSSAKVKVEGERKADSENGSEDFPSISSSVPGSSAPAASSKGRSWASIASVKSANQSEGANQSRVIPGASASGSDAGSGDGLANVASRLAGGAELNYVPSSLDSTGLKYDPADDGPVSDENDPVALALGEFLRNYALDHHSIALTPRGLCNQGNYCYINATLQSLLACPPFVNLFRAMGAILMRRPCRATPIIQNVYELVTEFEPLLRGNANKKDRMKDNFNVGSNLEPIGIRKCLGLLEGNTFKVEGRQEDAEEFLSHLLNGLHDEMLKVMKWAEQRKERSSGKVGAAQTNVPGQGATNGDGLELSADEDDDQWQVMGAKKKSCLTRKTTICKTPISEAFLGQMCYLYRENSSASYKSQSLQPFYTLQLDIQSDNIKSVKDALESNSQKEVVSGGEGVSGGTAYSQSSLEELPVVLILHLKRFVYEKNGNKIKKIDKKLQFGIDLEIGKEILSPNAKNRFSLRQRQYKLFGVVYHDGEEAHKGHYIADCFHASGGSMWGQCGWLRFDDTSVKQIPEGQMLDPLPPRVPYLLYYRRADTLLSHVSQQHQQKKDRP